MNYNFPSSETFVTNNLSKGWFDCSGHRKKKYTEEKKYVQIKTLVERGNAHENPKVSLNGCDSLTVVSFATL